MSDIVNTHGAGSVGKVSGGIGILNKYTIFNPNLNKFEFDEIEIKLHDVNLIEKFKYILFFIFMLPFLKDFYPIFIQWTTNAEKVIELEKAVFSSGEMANYASAYFFKYLGLFVVDIIYGIFFSIVSIILFYFVQKIISQSKSILINSNYFYLYDSKINHKDIRKIAVENIIFFWYVIKIYKNDLKPHKLAVISNDEVSFIIEAWQSSLIDKDINKDEESPKNG